MCYLKSLFAQFLIVFFANHLLPGIEVVDQTRLPHLGGDLLFSMGLGLLNSLIYPCFKLLHRGTTVSRFGLVALILNLAAYALLKLVPGIGIHITSIEGYVIAGFVVSAGSVIVNYREMKHAAKAISATPPEDPLKK